MEGKRGAVEKEKVMRGWKRRVEERLEYQGEKRRKEKRTWKRKKVRGK